MATATRIRTGHTGTGVMAFSTEKPLFPVIDTVVTDEMVGSLKVCNSIWVKYEKKTSIGGLV